MLKWTANWLKIQVIICIDYWNRYMGFLNRLQKVKSYASQDGKGKPGKKLLLIGNSIISKIWLVYQSHSKPYYNISVNLERTTWGTNVSMQWYPNNHAYNCSFLCKVLNNKILSLYEHFFKLRVQWKSNALRSKYIWMKASSSQRIG